MHFWRLPFKKKTKTLFEKKYFRKTISIKQLASVWPDRGPSCLQKLSADGTCRQRVED